MSYYIYSGDQSNLFRLESQTGNLFLRRPVESRDRPEISLVLTARDWGSRPRENNAVLELVIDVVNATFAAPRHGLQWDDKYIIIGGVVGGLTLVFSITVVVIIILLARRGSNRRPSHNPDSVKHIEWQLVVKTGVQEEGEKEVMTKSDGWSGSDAELDAKDGQYEKSRYGCPSSPPDVTRTCHDVTIKKKNSDTSQWLDGVIQWSFKH